MPPFAGVWVYLVSADMVCVCDKMPCMFSDIVRVFMVQVYMVCIYMVCVYSKQQQPHRH